MANNFDQSLPGDFSQFTPAQVAQAQAEAQAAVANLGRSYDSIAANAHDHRTNIAHLIDRLAERPSSTGTVKHREPRVFDGRADQVNPFLREINNAVFLQRRSLASDRDKVISPSIWPTALPLLGTERLNSTPLDLTS